MASEFNVLSSCRCCLEQQNEYINVFTTLDEFQNDISNLLLECTGMLILEHDHFSKDICEICLNDLSNAARFRLRCLKTEDFLKEVQQTNFDISMGANSVTADLNIEEATSRDSFECKVDQELHISPTSPNLVQLEESIEDFDEKPDILNANLTASNNTCNFCGKCFETSGELYSHYKKQCIDELCSDSDTLTAESNEDIDEKPDIIMVSADESIIKCSVCDKRFEDNVALRKHTKNQCGNDKLIEADALSNVKYSLKCSVCNEEVSNVNQHVQLHYKDCSIITLKCHLNNNQKLSKTSNQRRRRRKVRRCVRQAKCPKCKKRFRRRFELAKHMIDEHNEGLFKCDLCGKSYMYRSILERHKLTHPGGLDCEFCDRTFQSNTILATHRRLYCEQKPNLGDISEIASDDHPNDPEANHTSNTSLKCVICDEEFQSNASLIRHRRRCHSVQKFYKCSVCDKGFNHRLYLERHTCEKFINSNHKLRHNGKRPKSKDALPKVSSILDDHSYHLAGQKQRYIPVKPFQCNLCEKRYRTEYLRQRHVQTKHERAIKCPTCGKSIPSQSKLTLHLRSHTGERPFSCSYCDKRFAYKFALTKHECIHTGRRPHRCETCGKGFITMDSFRIHQYGHTHQWPFKCDICGKGFHLKSYLLKHMPVHGGNMIVQVLK
ncbi:zinc finger protein ZFP2-like [Sabethes cyaneus]|uniref:zinc finger protein ZFP2-like n=1 Tax=Sabethes cyaneus TaxID=53552 RepID=UPI00237DB538|nr:zinc finger protein ZFP2-like [Sabethes cyaneus]